MNDTPSIQFDPKQLDILRCPKAVHFTDKGSDPGVLTQVNAHWLACADSGNKYPIYNGIPYLIVKEGDRWHDTAEGDLPVPPPAPVE